MSVKVGDEVIIKLDAWRGEKHARTYNGRHGTVLEVGQEVTVKLLSGLHIFVYRSEVTVVAKEPSMPLAWKVNDLETRLAKAKVLIKELEELLK